MRLIIFVKIPERVEPITLDIIDDRPSQAVVDDILVIAKLATKNETASNYCLSRNGDKLDPIRELSQNGIKNGMVLDLLNEQIVPRGKNQFKEDAFQEALSESSEESSNTKKTPKKSNERSNVPGKKIDFD